MKTLFQIIFKPISIIRSFFKKRSELFIENLALRQQLAIYKQKKKRPKICMKDRLFWIILSRLWENWRDALIIVKPETVIGWHRKGFKLFWKFKSRKRRPGRPLIDKKTRKLIENMAKDNPLWGAPRLHGELTKLGIDVCEKTVSNIIRKIRKGKPPSQTWRTFIKNHMHNTYAIDFFTVPTATFRNLYVCVILWHESRKVVHFNVTDSPTAEWTAQQVVEACPWDTAPKYLIRDKDKIFGKYFQDRIKNLGIEEVITAFKSPWQNPFCERLIGSIRRGCIDHLIILNENHLKNILSDYFKYYHNDRTHLGLGKDTPLERPIQHEPEEGGKIIKFPRVGGLHHRYEWDKAA